jgi:hypothetical protein
MEDDNFIEYYWPESDWNDMSNDRDDDPEDDVVGATWDDDIEET